MKKNLRLFALALAVMLLLSGCGAKNYSDKSEEYTSDSYTGTKYATQANGESNSYVNGEKVTVPVLPSAENRKMIYTLNTVIETKAFEEAKDKLLADTIALGGYTSSVNISRPTIYSDGSRSAQYAYITVKIPVEKYEEFMSGLSGYGEVTELDMTADDVTEAYTDIETRLTALNQEKERLLVLMASTTATNEIIAVSDRLTDVIYEIEGYTAQKRNYDGLIAYCTVYIRLRDVSNTGVIATTFGSDVAEALRNSWISLVNFLQKLVLALIWIIPYALFFGVIIWLIVGIKRAYRKKHPLTEEQIAAKEAKKANRRLFGRKKNKDSAPKE